MAAPLPGVPTCRDTGAGGARLRLHLVAPRRLSGCGRSSRGLHPPLLLWTGLGIGVRVRRRHGTHDVARRRRRRGVPRPSIHSRQANGICETKCDCMSCLTCWNLPERGLDSHSNRLGLSEFTIFILMHFHRFGQFVYCALALPWFILFHFWCPTWISPFVRVTDDSGSKSLPIRIIRC